MRAQDVCALRLDETYTAGCVASNPHSRSQIERVGAAGAKALPERSPGGVVETVSNCVTVSQARCLFSYEKLQPPGWSRARSCTPSAKRSDTASYIRSWRGTRAMDSAHATRKAHVYTCTRACKTPLKVDTKKI